MPSNPLPDRSELDRMVAAVITEDGFHEAYNLNPEDWDMVADRMLRAINYPASDRMDDWAKEFHDTYERLAPQFGYETRRGSAVSWEDVPEQNRRLMEATVEHVMRGAVARMERVGLLAEWIERDRRESDKVLMYAAELANLATAHGRRSDDSLTPDEQSARQSDG